MTSNKNGNNDNSNHDKDGNVIQFKPRPKEVVKKSQDIEQNAATQNEPLINLPPVTKYLTGILLALHIIFHFILSDEQFDDVVLNFGFISYSFTHFENFKALDLITPLSHIFIHGGALHIAMNAVMLIAFGSGVEKWIGGKKLLIVFIGSALFGLLAHFLMNLQSIGPVIGASGGISGLFAVALIMLNKTRGMAMGSRKYGMWPVIILWVGISALFGMMGSPDGSLVAWEAHIGGFLGGFIMAKILRL